MFRIGDFSRVARVSARLLRFYDEIGLLTPARTDRQTGYRYYTVAQLAKLNRITVLKELGFSLEEIRSLFRLVNGGHSSCSDVQAVTLEHLEDVRKKIADLQRLERTLSQVVSRCQGGSVPDCPIVEALYAPAHGAET